MELDSILMSEQTKSRMLKTDHGMAYRHEVVTEDGDARTSVARTQPRYCPSRSSPMMSTFHWHSCALVSHSRSNTADFRYSLPFLVRVCAREHDARITSRPPPRKAVKIVGLHRGHLATCPHREHRSDDA